MVIHYWGEDVDWVGINKSARYIGQNLKRFGRINVRDYKEKFGTVRVYCSLGWGCLFNITHPGWVSYKVAGYPKWIMKLDIYWLSKIIPFLFNWWVIPYHKWLYRHLYKKAIKKWSHLREEIICCADYFELLGGL